MASLEDTIRTAVPGGNVGKPLMLALIGLLASGALFKSGAAGVPFRPRLSRCCRIGLMRTVAGDRDQGGAAGKAAERPVAGWDHNLKDRTISPATQLFIDCAREIAKQLPRGVSPNV